MTGPLRHNPHPPLELNGRWKNMINQVVWIWQYQEPETNKYRKSLRQKWNQNILGFLAQPKTHLPVSNRAFYLSFILVKHLLWHFWKKYKKCNKGRCVISVAMLCESFSYMKKRVLGSGVDQKVTNLARGPCISLNSSLLGYKDFYFLNV